MPSIAIKGSLYLAKPELADRHGPFRYRFLVEGDSWMDMSSPLRGSLPHFLAQELNRRNVSALIINISTGGHTLRRITEMMSGEFGWWLHQDPYDAILFSAAGNDFIDAACSPAAGQGLLLDMGGQPVPADGYQCVRQSALKSLVEGYLGLNFDTIYQAIRASQKNTSAPLFLNCYDTPVARNAPAAPGLGPWLYKAYRKNSVAPSLWPSLTGGLFNDIRKTIEAWPTGRTGVHVVPTIGRLVPAQASSTGSSGDWANEIHPNASGWRKLVPVWADAILAQVDR